jgi:hypothetical protein
MIINQDGGPMVPDKTIAFFPVTPYSGLKKFNLEDIGLFLRPLNTDHSREWFTPHFYKCLPLAIGNMQGFVFSLPYRFSLFWNGGDKIEDVSIGYHEDFNKYKNINFIYPISEFGNGIATIHFPLTLKTPPGVNLITIAPPNFPLPGLSPMTGVVESDNLRFSFTLNIKIDLPNTVIEIEPNYPLVGLLPIPRYFCDSFELKNAYDIFDKNVVDEEIKVVDEHGKKRHIQNNQTIKKSDKLYYLGKDVRGNKFKDHQLPIKKKNKK